MKPLTRPPHACRIPIALLTLALAANAFAQSAPVQPPGAAPGGEAPPAPVNADLAPLSASLSGGAKADYDAAHLLFDDHDYAGARLKFMSAYEASKDARLLWSAATCEKNLRHYAKAIGLVTRYLRVGPPFVTPDSKLEAQRFLDAVMPLTSELAIVSATPDAQVFVDEELIGSTPLTEAARVDIGARRVSVRKDGYKSFETTLTVSGATPLRVEAKLQKIVHQGRLVVHAGRSDVISIDGRGVGSGTWQATLPSGGHSLRVTAPDHHPFQQEVLIQDGESRTVDVALEPNSRGLPTWAWIAGGAVLAAGAATGGYFLFRPSDTTTSPTAGTIQPGTIQLPLSR